MEPVSILKDEDIFENPTEEPKFYKVRPTAKAIVIDEEGNIALLSIREHFLFPGGGIEKGETPEEACIRECKEEIGCDIEIVAYIGQFDQYRAVTAKKYEIHFFVAYVVGEKGERTTDDEDERNCVLVWENVESVNNLLETQLGEIPTNEYPVQFNSFTHLAAFQKFLEMRL